MNLKINQIKVGAILSYVIIFLDIIIGILYVPFLTAKLGQSEYGLYSLVASIISYLTVLDLGFGNAITIYTSKYLAKKDKEQEQKLHGMFFLIYIVIGVVAGAIGLILRANVNNMFNTTMSAAEMETAKTLMSILTLNLVVTFPFSIFSSIITAYEKFVFSKIVNIVRIVLAPLIMIPLLLLGHKSITLVSVITVLNIACLLINMLYCLRALKIKLRFKGFDFKLLAEIFSYSFFIFLNVIIDKVNWSVDNFILAMVKGTTQVAIYAVAAQFNNIYLMFSTAISGVLLPKISKMESNNATDEEFSNIFIQTGRLQYIILGLVITGFVVFGRRFIELLYGPQYLTAYIIACILMIPVTLPLIQNVGVSILQAKHKHKFRVLILLLIAVFNVIISVPLAKLYGGIGSAIGTAIAFVLGQILILNIYYYKKIHLDIPKFLKEICKLSLPIVLTFFVGILLYTKINLVNSISLVILIVLYTVLYSLLMWNFGMNDYEKDLVEGILERFTKKDVK